MSKDKISLEQVLSGIFEKTHTQIKHNIVFGTGFIGKQCFNILGTIENTSFGVEEAMEMSKHVLSLLQSNNTDPILLLTDVVGQKLSVRDEWLGMYAYFAHLLKCLHLARQHGNTMISIIYNQAIGGSFIAFGLMADRIFALKNASLAVMWLEAVAKVIKIDIEVLKKISKTSPVFAPGAENFKRLGGIHEVLELSEVPQHLLAVLQQKNCAKDNRAALGKKYGGRTKAYDIIRSIESLPPPPTTNSFNQLNTSNLPLSPDTDQSKL